MKKLIVVLITCLSVFGFSQVRNKGLFGGFAGGLAIPNNKLGLYYEFEGGYFFEKNYFFAKFDHVNSKSWDIGAVAYIIPVITGKVKIHTNEMSVLYGYNLLEGKWKIIPSAGLGIQHIKKSFVNNDGGLPDYTQISSSIFVPVEISFIRSAFVLKTVGGIGKSSYGGVAVGFGFGH